MTLKTWLLSIALCISISNGALAEEAHTTHAVAWQNSTGWWNEVNVSEFDKSKILQQLPLVKVEGNKFVNYKGEAIVFRGINISDPDKLIKEGRFTRKHFEVIKSWGANIVRIPVHPVNWRARGKNGYLPILDQTIAWINELGMYSIVDWHSMGNLKSDMYQAPMYYTSKPETLDFFRVVSARYQGIYSVAMYEIFNEPTTYNGRLGTLTWHEWKAINEEVISVIQAHNPDAISLVAGFNWAYDLTPIATAPIVRSNVAYVSHPYPMKVGPPYEANWERDWGFVANKYPVIATEIGYQLATDKGAHVPVIDDGSYGPRITDYMAKKGVSWVAWVFDPDWAPQLIKDWDYTPTMQGKHFREVMLNSNPT